ncbi:MAG: HD domain-containing protein [Dehalococcoidia bacterium]|nr:HD domain-containing protein [Dehalococcoidia bacterium]
MQIELESKARRLLSSLQTSLAQSDCRGYIVGGFLRDLALGRPARDIDIAISGNALTIGRELARELGARAVPLDGENGVTRLILTSQKDSGWQIDLSPLRGDLTADLRHRDLTLNAMACDIAIPPWGGHGTLSIELIDPLGGLKDIRARLVRATGDEVFRQDAIRLLRAVRLAAELEFKVESTTEALIRRDAPLIQHEAGERVREEFLRLLMLSNTDETLFYMYELGLLTAIIPELAPSVGLEQRGEHQWDVFRHSIRSVAALDFLLRCGPWPYASADVLQNVPWDESLAGHFQTPISPTSTRRELDKLAALLHDIAKPQTKTIAPNGKLRFYGHPQEGAPIAEEIAERLRFSTREKRLITAVVRYHLRPVQMGEEGAMPTKRAVYRLVRDLGEMAPDVLFFSLADHLATRGEELDLTNWHHHANIVSYVLAESARTLSTLPAQLLNGHDLQRELGLAPGVRLGEILAELREAQGAGEVSSRDEALDYASRLLNEKT